MDFKEKNEMVSAIINRLRNRLPENINYNPGEPLRDILEAIMEEVDIQYWQLEQVYNSAFIDTAVGEDLDKLVAIFGESRNPATPARGNVIFYREAPADTNYIIPQGTLVGTLNNVDGESVQFQTTQNVILLEGETEVSAPIVCTDRGAIGNVPANTIRIINNPPVGIEFVKNISPTFGGVDRESDESLRDRTKHILDSKGKATLDALEYSIRSNVPEIDIIRILDMERGIGTVDIIVMGSVVPMPQETVDKLRQTIEDTRSAGIDVEIYEPDIVLLDVDLNLILKPGYEVNDIKSDVEEAIFNYVNKLNIGETLILNQLERRILNTNEIILDIIVNTPNQNVEVTQKEVIRLGTITIG